MTVNVSSVAYVARHTGQAREYQRSSLSVSNSSSTNSILDNQNLSRVQTNSSAGTVSSTHNPNKPKSKLNLPILNSAQSDRASSANSDRVQQTNSIHTKNLASNNLKSLSINLINPTCSDSTVSNANQRLTSAPNLLSSVKNSKSIRAPGYSGLKYRQSSRAPTSSNQVSCEIIRKSANFGRKSADFILPDRAKINRTSSYLATTKPVNILNKTTSSQNRSHVSSQVINTELLTSEKPRKFNVLFGTKHITKNKLLSKKQDADRDKDKEKKRFLQLPSVLKRLSLRNFMEYCVSALNEASSSCASNRFDLTLCEGTIWFLGRNYRMAEEADEIKHDILSKLWITYRRNFPPIDSQSRYVTDRGFGCMIRCGQMVLANALINSRLGKQWRWNPDGLESNPSEYIEILRLFQDKFSSKYSIHNIVHVGEDDGKPIGEWFGPNTIAQALKKISRSPMPTNQNTGSNILYPEVCIEIALDNVVIADTIRKNCKKLRKKINDKIQGQSTIVPAIKLESQDEWTPALLFIPLRLGLSKINPIYFEALKKTFHFPQSLGIIGGRPNHALYLVGHIENDIIYLDPHTTQSFVDFDEYLEAKSENYKNSRKANELNSERESYESNFIGSDFIGRVKTQLGFSTPENTETVDTDQTEQEQKQNYQSEFVELIDDRNSDTTNFKVICHENDSRDDSNSKLVNQKNPEEICKNIDDDKSNIAEQSILTETKLTKDQRLDEIQKKTQNTNRSLSSSSNYISNNPDQPPIDATYHCDAPEKMPIDRLDPSLALCFYFHTEKDFDDWCIHSNTKLIESESQPMFEITKSRPSFWPKSPSSSSSASSDIADPSSVVQDKQSSPSNKNNKNESKIQNLKSTVPSCQALTSGAAVASTDSDENFTLINRSNAKDCDKKSDITSKFQSNVCQPAGMPVLADLHSHVPYDKFKRTQISDSADKSDDSDDDEEFEMLG